MILIEFHSYFYLERYLPNVSQLLTCRGVKENLLRYELTQRIYHSVTYREINRRVWRGALGFSVLRIWPTFDSVFRFSLSIIAGFRFWCLMRFAVFLQFNLWFSVFVKNDGGFSDSSAQFMLRFFWFCQGSHSHHAVTLKLLFQG